MLGGWAWLGSAASPSAGVAGSGGWSGRDGLGVAAVEWSRGIRQLESPDPAIGVAGSGSWSCRERASWLRRGLHSKTTPAEVDEGVELSMLTEIDRGQADLRGSPLVGVGGLGAFYHFSVYGDCEHELSLSTFNVSREKHDSFVRRHRLDFREGQCHRSPFFAVM